MLDPYEQLSFFHTRGIANRCADGEEVVLEDPEAWMLEIVPGGEHAAFVDGKPLVLAPVPFRSDQVRAEHRYHHYTIGWRVYASVFVG